ncbi:MAG: MAPEG family protein [Gammaproteobacteria bacterium]
MEISPTKELYWLAATVLMTAVLWVPYIVQRIIERGLWNALYDPQGETETRAPWANRMMRAHANAIENLTIFAPLVLLLHAQGVSTSFTTKACAIFFFARAVHYVVFSLGIPLLRVPAFLVGFACQMVIASALFGWA